MPIRRSGGDVMPSKRSVRSESGMPSDLTLRRPREDEEEEFLRAHHATSPEVPTFLHYYEDGMPFRGYLEVLAEQQHGVNLPANHVPSTFLFAFVGHRIVGRAEATALAETPTVIRDLLVLIANVFRRETFNP